jgi:hypothetical protein
VDDPHDGLFRLMQDAGEGNQASAAARKRWLRRMMALLGTSCLAFALTALWLARQASRTSLQSADSQAVEVVQAHFAAIDRGDFRAAYGLFSTRLRREMPFDEFREIMEAHLPLLQGRVSVYPETTGAGRVVVDIAFHGRQPMGLTAEFMLVRSRGRWWIDNFHWNVERPRPQHLILT